MAIIDNETRDNLCEFLLRCLACIVWHGDELIYVENKIPGPPFSMIPILSKGELLQTFQTLVTKRTIPNMP